jgi:solute carrier family 8 (sodium/calcium exchanger)
MRETQGGTKHFFDIWHVARSVAKQMMKAGKEKGCEVILSWIKGVRNHIYWCATSTKEGFKQMILAKWKSFLYHVVENWKHPVTGLKLVKNIFTVTETKAVLNK